MEHVHTFPHIFSVYRAVKKNDAFWYCHIFFLKVNSQNSTLTEQLSLVNKCWQSIVVNKLVNQLIVHTFPSKLIESFGFKIASAAVVSSETLLKELILVLLHTLFDNNKIHTRYNTGKMKANRHTQAHFKLSAIWQCLNILTTFVLLKSWSTTLKRSFLQ